MQHTVLITGASRGIGFAAARLFAEKGWNVAICSRNQHDIQKAATAITEATSNQNVAGFAADMADGPSIAQLFRDTAERFGNLNALVNNAAVLHTGDIFSLTDEQFQDMLNINVVGLARCCRHAFSIMKEKGGDIVNISSVAGIQFVDKFDGLWAYSATKFAVTGLTEALASEGKRYGIRVNAIAPGATDTDMLQQAAPGYKPDAKPEDIAPLIHHLCDRQQSAILNGAVIPVLF
ncbi:MAG: SDR family NAD(P)-dependent oxidoreductase [Alphaproteobacteria bacterium]